MNKRNIIRLIVIVALFLCIGFLLYEPENDNSDDNTGDSIDIIKEDDENPTLDLNEEENDSDELTSSKEEAELPSQEKYEPGENDTEVVFPDSENSKKPEKPSQSEKPSKPEEVEKPNQPEVPIQPEQPEQPSQPEQPTESDKTPEIDEGKWTDPV